ncbi:MAG: cytochrome c oxidase accessory protein CcoG [Acidobacteria bacterium]|nr:cytochrome c oxidase accessory protein CcoG [Acidobacteriota bacterium]MCB9397464.1 cytochrome c oxidase accessory protein CcoG [Acidobacteriota bacterium]
MSSLKPVKERVTTIGDRGKRFWLYPAAFHGDWVKRRRWVAYCLILIFFLLPWTKVGGHQTILLDVAERKFAFFGFTLWPQDTFIFWFFALGSVVSIFFITAQWGRLWCGWACPQTVFLEHIFRRIETWVEGSATHRKKLDEGPWTGEKIRKKLTKWFLFLIVSSHFANTVLCYFVGTDQVLHMTFQPPTQNWPWFTFMLFFNALFFLDFAWFREQFCIIACPYGRFQSVLLDKESMIVGYDTNRGEPRGVLRKNQERTQGDCIDCKRCVAVCPTGIDIRMGLQMECINCTACMDACDEIMTKVEKPKGLIRYTSIAELEGRARKFIRPRTVLYGLILGLAFSVGAILFSAKSDVIVRFLRPKGTTFTQTQDKITNLFQVKAVNKSAQPVVLTFKTEAGIELVSPHSPWQVDAQQTATSSLFISVSPDLFPGRGTWTVPIQVWSGSKQINEIKISLLGPAHEL